MENKKKIIIIAIIIVAIIALLSTCGDNSSKTTSSTTSMNKTTSSTTSTKTCTHSYTKISTKATCTSGGNATYKCSLCSKTKTEYESALGHTTNSGTCSRCGTQSGTWEITYYVDEFGQYTNEAYIRNKNYFVGTFSNSATTNSKLYAQLLIDANYVAIRLLEYGSHLVKASSTTYYSITYLDEAGRKYSSTGAMYKNGDRILLDDRKLLQLLEENDSVDIYIKENSKYGVNSTYLVTIYRENFNTVHKEYYKQTK